MEKIDWTSESNQYDLRVRRPGKELETIMILAGPRSGVDADIEFAANWSKEEIFSHEPKTQVFSVTDVGLRVTYLASPFNWPASLDGPLGFYRHNYIVPDRADNPRFFSVRLVHRTLPAETREYSVAITRAGVHEKDIAAEIRKDALLKSGNWQLVKQSIREICLEQHCYQTWQRRQHPNYFLWQEAWKARQEEESNQLTIPQTTALMQITRAGYVLRYTDAGWEVGQVKAQGKAGKQSYSAVIMRCPTPAEAINQAAEQLRIPGLSLGKLKLKR